MKKSMVISAVSAVGLLVVACISCASCAGKGDEARLRESFNDEWRFHPGDAAGAETVEYDDGEWRALDVPHDWSIEGDFAVENPATPGSGALPGGIGWYRKSFVPQQRFEGERFYIDFDGVYWNSTVWVNGTLLGHRPNGYISFRYDLTPYLRQGEENVVAVRVDNSEQPNSRWYTGSGIYRNVWLVRTGELHIDNWGTFVTAGYEVAENRANVSIDVTVRNASAEAVEAVVWTEILDPHGKRVAATERTGLAGLAIETGECAETVQRVAVAGPELWSPENPAIYTAVTHVEREGVVVDSYETPFGIRSFEFDAGKGFFLNGEAMKIKGVCMHHDLGCLGSAVNVRAIERQLEILRAMGCNSIRTSHNPPAPELLDLCDRMGFLVMDETFDVWRKRKTEHDYSHHFGKWYERDLTDHVLRDRNHPSVVMWSIGNEVLEQWLHVETDTMDIQQANTLLNFAGRMSGQRYIDTTMHVNALLTRKMADMVRELDPTRPVTAGCNETRPFNFLFEADALDIIGFNYHEADWLAFPEVFPGKKLLVTESTSALASRGYYMMPSDTTFVWPVSWDVRFTQAVNHCSAYDNCHVPWGSSHETSLKMMRDHDWVSGIYVWTGFDYLGEPTPFWWPSRSSYFGIVDLAGFPKDAYYLYQSEWTTDDVLHIFPHWNWSEGQEVDVWAYYNNADEVELLVNGRSLGRRAKQNGEMHVAWRVPFEAGVLEAVSYLDGREVLRREVRTAGEAVAVRLTPDRTRIEGDGSDLSFVTVELVDAEGVAVPTASELVRFTVEGGRIVGTDNGDPTDGMSLSRPERKLFSGKALAVVQATGRGSVTLTASVEGIGSETVKIKVK